MEEYKILKLNEREIKTLKKILAKEIFDTNIKIDKSENIEEQNRLKTENNFNKNLFYLIQYLER